MILSCGLAASKELTAQEASAVWFHKISRHTFLDLVVEIRDQLSLDICAIEDLEILGLIVFNVELEGYHDKNLIQLLQSSLKKF